MSLDDEVNRVRARQQAAMDAKAQEGSTREGVFMAGIRAALDHTVENVDPSLADLEAALGEKFDAGSFLMGMMGATFAMQGLDLTQTAKLHKAIFTEYIGKARQR